jgi:chitosanase
MYLSAQQKRICEQVINVFETGKSEGDYSAIATEYDAPGDIKQITYGRSQTTETGNLSHLLKQYIDANGVYSQQFRSYVPKIGVISPTNSREFVLVNNVQFKDLLEDAGNHDSVMRQVQDQFFDEYYFQPAMMWAERNGFTLALSALVIYDSFSPLLSLQGERRSASWLKPLLALGLAEFETGLSCPSTDELPV